MDLGKTITAAMEPMTALDIAVLPDSVLAWHYREAVIHGSNQTDALAADIVARWLAMNPEPEGLLPR
jgi:hypothetical protein